MFPPSVQQNIDLYLSKYKSYYKNIWQFLHLTTFMYPIDPTTGERELFETFFTSIATYLPCKNCSDNWQNIHIKTIKLDDRDSLITWLFDVHNDINKPKMCKQKNEFIQEYSDSHIHESFEHEFGITLNIQQMKKKGFLNLVFTTISDVVQYP